MEKKEFLTIRKQIYHYFLEKNINKVIRFFDKETDILPPTIDYVINQYNCRKLEPIEKTLNLEIKKPSEEEITKFAENIEIQKKIIDNIKLRNENYNYRC
jgi:hypothetical protein